MSGPAQGHCIGRLVPGKGSSRAAVLTSCELGLGINASWPLGIVVAVDSRMNSAPPTVVAGPGLRGVDPVRAGCVFGPTVEGSEP